MRRSKTFAVEQSASVPSPTPRAVCAFAIAENEGKRIRRVAQAAHVHRQQDRAVHNANHSESGASGEAEMGRHIANIASHTMVYLPHVVYLALGGCQEGPPELSVPLESLVIYDDPYVRDSAVFGWPTVARITPDASAVWVLDYALPGVHYLATTQKLPTRTFGRSGSGPGELRGPTYLAVDPQGRAVVGDVSNGKLVVLDTTGATTDIITATSPHGVVIPNAQEIWVAGDLFETVFVRYRPDGTRFGSIALNDALPAPRFNRGIAARGHAPCAAIFAFVYRTEIRCFAQTGVEVWRAVPPNPISPSRDMDPYRMSEDDVFAYADVAMTSNRVYALYVGHPARRDGIASNLFHIFRAEDGSFLGTAPLPETVNRFTIRHGILVTVTYRPEPRITIYQMEQGS